MKEIKIRFGKGGKTKITSDKASAGDSAQFTEKLAKELGSIEERHKGGQYHSQGGEQQVEQKA